MCGRYTLTRSGRKLRDTFELDDAPELDELPPRYNIAPTQESLMVRPADDGRRRAELATWGFGAGTDRRLLINARAETVDVKPSFRDSFARRRCLVPADGFYEWRRRRGRSHPFHFSAADDSFLAFGGLWKPTLDPAAGPGLVFTIVTVPANELVAEVHPRMPLILPAEEWSRWLDTAIAGTEIKELLVPYPVAAMSSREVATTVNTVGHDSPDCLASAETPAAVQLDLLT